MNKLSNRIPVKSRVSHHDPSIEAAWGADLKRQNLESPIRPNSSKCFLFICVLVIASFSASVKADPIVGLDYVANSTLRTVGFDGTQFTSGFTNLENLVPDWNAMSYDADTSTLFYVANSTLRSVGFDGTQFTSGFTNLENLVPDWTAMSFVPSAQTLFYVANATLRSVGFDGTQFTSGFSNLENLVPDWNAMSYDVDTSTLFYVANSTLRSVGFDGTQFTSGFTNLENLVPDWNGMSLVHAPSAVVPEPATLALLGIGFLGLRLARRKTA